MSNAKSPLDPTPGRTPVVLEGYTFLPGLLLLRRGCWTDYKALHRFHYLLARPATHAAIAAIDYIDHHGTRPVGVAVLSYPVPRIKPRDRAFNLAGLTFGEHCRFANANLRTISRLIIHPQFRGVGLTRPLIDWLINACPTRYVETLARMGRVHPMFQRAGMRLIPPLTPQEPAYFILDKHH